MICEFTDEVVDSFVIGLDCSQGDDYESVSGDFQRESELVFYCLRFDWMVAVDVDEVWHSSPVFRDLSVLLP